MKMENINNCDKNKLYKILQKISRLIDETPKNNLLRYLMNNDKNSMWETTYLFILIDAGVIKIYNKEIDVDGKNIFYLQIVDYKKFYRFERKFIDNGENDISSYFSFDDMTFKLKTINNNVAAINFHPTREGTTNPFCLMKAFVEYIKEHYKRNGSYLETVVPKQYIFEYIEEKFPNIVKDDQEQWLKTTKGNLIKKIPKEYLSLIKLKDFDSKNKGYPFSLKLPI